MPERGWMRRMLKSLRRLGAGDEQWARVVMNRRTRAMVADLSPETLKTLEISGNVWDQWMSFREYRSVSY